MLHFFQQWMDSADKMLGPGGGTFLVFIGGIFLLGFMVGQFLGRLSSGRNYRKIIKILKGIIEEGKQREESLQIKLGQREEQVAELMMGIIDVRGLLSSQGDRR